MLRVDVRREGVGGESGPDRVLLGEIDAWRIDGIDGFDLRFLWGGRGLEADIFFAHPSEGWSLVGRKGGGVVGGCRLLGWIGEADLEISCKAYRYRKGGGRMGVKSGEWRIGGLPPQRGFLGEDGPTFGGGRER